MEKVVRMGFGSRKLLRDWCIDDRDVLNPLLCVC
jgi:hypothetical protein